MIEKDTQFREYFTTTGVIGAQKIKDPKKRESQQKKRRRLYQNTQVLMSLILWAGPTSESSRWLEIIAMLEEMKMD